jgi:peptidylprolyl isomerase
MSTIKSGDTVRIHYTGTLTTGETFDSSDGRDPLEFTVGSGMVIPGLDVALPGMALGEKKTVNIASDQAYGPRHEEGIQAVPKADFPPEIPLEVGLQLQMQTPDGRAMPVTIADISETEVTLDANHQLAGKDLIFDIEIMGIDAA